MGKLVAIVLVSAFALIQVPAFAQDKAPKAEEKSADAKKDSKSTDGKKDDAKAADAKKEEQKKPKKGGC